MGKLITLTPAPVRVVAGSSYQPIYTALDVAEFDELFLLVQVLSIEGATSPSATFNILTGLQTDTDDGWLSAWSLGFSSVTSTYAQLVKGNFLQMLRWNISTFTGMSAITFWIGGVGRTY